MAAASLAGMAIALGLAVTAYVARNDAQRRQAQAEDILGFMLGDLRKKLTTVGRLDLMRAVDDKAMTYFATLDPRDLSDRALEEQARSLTGIGEVRLNEGKHDAAMAAFREAHARSTALHQRAPDNGQRLFDLAQAEYWIGFVALEQGRYDESGVWFRKYRDSGDPAGGDGSQELRLATRSRLRPPQPWRCSTSGAGATRKPSAPCAKSWRCTRPGSRSARMTWNCDSRRPMSRPGSAACRPQQGKLADAEAFFAEQVDAMQSQSWPRIRTNAEWKEVRIDALLLLADAQAQRGRLSASRASVAAASPWPTRCRRSDPSQQSAGRCHLGICRWWQAQLVPQVQHRRRVAAADAAASLLAIAHAAEPKNESMLSWLVRARNLQAQLALARGDLAVARTNLSAARALLEPAWQARKNEDLATVAGKDPPA